MKILFLHNKYLVGGGEDVSTQSEIDLLKLKGHDVDFIFLDNKEIAHMSSIQLVTQTIWSRRSYKLVSDALSVKDYDIVHVQNFFPLLSPSIFYAAKKKGVKVVMSVRNYRLVCPNGLMFTNNEVCKRCVGKVIPLPALKYRCYKDDFKASFVVAAMLSLHNIIATWNKSIDAFVAISEFVKNQMVLGNIDPSKVYVKYNFVSNPLPFNACPDDYFLYVGRLSVEKGLDVLIRAFSSENLTSTKLLIVGDGPLKDRIKESCKANPNIVYLGKLEPQKAYEVMSNARALIFPSKWHEPFGRTVIEAFSSGTPVIGAAVGGVTELIKHNRNGLLFTSGDDVDLAYKIGHMSTTADYLAFRKNARTTFEKQFTAERSYHDIMEIYQNVLDG